MEYLTEEDYKIAKENGISRKVAYSRFYCQHWSRKRTITEPVQGSLWREHKELCEKNGIAKATFYQRLLRMTPMEAATVPTMDKMAALRYGRAFRWNNKKGHEDPLTEWDYTRAEKRGISRELADERYYGDNWTKERSVTQPPRGKLWSQYKGKCEEIGLSRQQFHKRIKKMTPDEAVSYPPGGRGRKEDEDIGGKSRKGTAASF